MMPNQDGTERVGCLWPRKRLVCSTLRRSMTDLEPCLRAIGVLFNHLHTLSLNKRPSHLTISLNFLHGGTEYDIPAFRGKKIHGLKGIFCFFTGEHVGFFWKLYDVLGWDRNSALTICLNSCNTLQPVSWNNPQN
jgi:hypothetical protein